LVRIVDVKPAHRLADPAVAALFDWTAQTVGARGWAFEAWSGADATLLDNVRFLAGYRRPAVIDPALLARAPDLLAPALLEATGDERGPLLLDDAENLLAAHAPLLLARPVLLHLIWSGRLHADLSRPLGRTTALRAVATAGAAG